MDTKTDSLPRFGSREIKDAIEDLLKSCGFQDANVEHTVSDTLLHCNFHSEEGKLHVINNLQRLSGTTVVKRICEGLSKLSRAYPDSKQFEEEAIKLVDLCCSQSEALMQNGCKDGCQLASPLDIIDWTIELCEELMTPKEGIYHKINQSITLSSYLSKVRKIYEILRNARLVILLENQDGRIEVRDPFKSLFQALKPRIHFDTFDELLDQAIFIIQADELLDPKMLSKLHTKKDSLLLKCWILILNMSFLSNRFVVAIAKHDFLVHNNTFARNQPFSDESTYDESLIYSVCNALNDSITNNQDFKLTCDEARLRLTFLPEHSEVLLRYPSLCFELLQSEVRIDQIQEVLELLQIKRDDTLLPVISNTESEKLEIKLKTYQQSLLSGNPMKLDEFLGGNSRQLTSASRARYQQRMICSVVFNALIDLPGDREQLVDVLRMWKDRFPNDNSHTVLFAIISLVECLKQQGTRDCMGKLKTFLTQLSTKHLGTFPIWPSIVKGLITALPTTWFTQECNLINCILNKFRESTDLRDVIAFKVQSIKNFVESLAVMQVSEQVKRKAIKIGLDLFDYTARPPHYELMLNVTMFVASDMSSGKIRKYVSDLLKAVCQVEVQYSQVWNVVRLIHTSSSIEDKEEILLCFLKVLENTKWKGEIEEKMSACAGFFRFPVNSANAKRFLQQAVHERTMYNSVLYYLSINESTLDRDNNFNVHIEFLLKIILNSKMEHRDLLFMTVKNNIQWLYYPSVEIFEVIMTCIAGSLAVGSFNQESNNEVLRLLHAAVRTHQLSAPNDVLSLYLVLIQGIRKVSCLGHNGSCTKRFAEGIDLIIKLPLPFLQLKLLIHSMANILEEGKFSKEEEVTNIMFHLFKLPSSKCSFTDSNVLASHFNRLTSKSNGLFIASKLSQLSIHKRIGKSETGLNSLMELLMKKIPTAFEDGSTVDLFIFLKEEFFKEPPAFLQVSLSLIDAAIKETISVEAFKAKIKEIAQKIPYIPPEQVPVFIECILEFYALEMDEKLDIYLFIEVLLSLNWNMFDMRRMCGNLIPLNIPKHLVSVFKGKRSLKEIIPELYRILDVASNFNPSITLSMTPSGKDSGNQILELLEHDLNMLLNHTCLRSSDVCLALLLYKNCHIMEVLSVFLLKDKVSLKYDNEWPLRYDQTKLLTPGKLAYLILHQLRRLGVAEIKTEINKICCKLVKNYNHDAPRTCTNQQLALNKFEEYFELFIRIMDESATLAEVRHWLDEFSAEHALQCKNVIMAACSWKAGRRTFQEAAQMNKKASATLSKLLNRPVASAVNASGNNDLASKLDIMVDVIKKIEDVQIVGRLFNLLCLSARSTAACLEVIPSWSKDESHLLVEQIEILYQGEKDTKQEEIDKDLAIVLAILPFAKTALQNSAMKLMDFLRATDEKNGGISDDMSLRRLPVWYKQMTDAGYPSQVIHSWCTSLVFSKSLSSGEVDALANLTPETIKFITKETDYIGKSLFSKDAPKTWKTKNALVDQKNTECFKRCLLLARLVNEYFLIAHQLKDNEEVVQKIKDGTQELCRIFEDENTPTGKIYKSRDNLLKELFVLLFSETKDKKSVTQLMKLEPLSKSLVMLLRRLARSVVRRPNTFQQVKMVLSNIQKSCEENLSPSQQYRLVQNNLHEEVLSLDQNQACIYLLEASGYNKSTAHKENVWYSSSIQMSAYVPTIESVEKNRLVRLMRQLWGEWRIILSENNTHEVEVNGRRAKTAEMFRYSDSLEEMEAQLEAAKKSSRLLPEDDWSTYRSRELIRREKAMRAKIKRHAKEVEKTNGKPGQLKLTKATIVWENRLLETIKMCSEKIPGCYAPNGFHSEKPVICGIAVDNRILTLYKEDHGGTRTEIENAEIKLYPAGMVVFGAYRSIHPYDTEQMWAAFYKMLLDKRLVPKIFITNVSPAFYWIKQFVTPETSRPERNFSLPSSCHLIPTSEDSYDYDPDICIHRLHTLLSHDNMKELIILTKEKAKRIQIRNIKPPNRSKLIRKMIDKVVPHLQDDGGLKEMHLMSHDKILDRLKFAIRHAVEIAVDGGKPTMESISRSIDMKRLLYRCEDGHQYSKDDYSAVILEAVNTVTEDLQGTNTSYDGCQHVVFFQPNEN